MRVDAKIRHWLRHKRIALDTSFLIPLLEEEGKEGRRYTRIFELIERRRATLITSTVTLLEILVHPYRNQDESLVNQYYAYMTRQPGLELIAVSPEVADRAAELRARYGFKTPDAIQIASALWGQATLFLTQDHGFRKQKEIEIGFI